MKHIAVALALVTTFAGCAEGLRHANRMLLGASVIAMTCDWGSTRRIASQGWKTGTEANPLLGLRPTTTRVDAYMGTMVAGTIVLGLLLPEKLRAVFLGSTFALEAGYSLNIGTVDGVCGFPAHSVVAPTMQSAR